MTYKGHYVGEYSADILVEGVLVIELKCRTPGPGAHCAMPQLSASLRPDPEGECKTSFNFDNQLGFAGHVDRGLW